MDLAAPVLWKNIRSLSKRDILNAHFTVSTSAQDLGTLSSWNQSTVSLHGNAGSEQLAWEEPKSSSGGQSCDLPSHSAWPRSWANVNTWCCLSFPGYFYIVNIKPRGLFFGPKANWPSLACSSTAQVTQKRVTASKVPLGKCSLFRLTPSVALQSASVCRVVSHRTKI